MKEIRHQPDDINDLTFNLENPEVVAAMSYLQFGTTTLFSDMPEELMTKPLKKKKVQRKAKSQKREVEDTVNKQPKKKKEMISR